MALERLPSKDRRLAVGLALSGTKGEDGVSTAERMSTRRRRGILVGMATGYCSSGRSMQSEP